MHIDNFEAKTPFLKEYDYFKGILYLNRANSEHGLYLSEDQDDIFYKVPRHILSFIDGCPSKVCHLTMTIIEDDRIMFCASEVEEEKPRFSRHVNIERIHRMIENEGIKVDDMQILNIKYRHHIITRAISTYIKRNL